VAKRTNGEGTIYQRTDGLWIADLTLGYDDNGKRLKKVFSSKNLDVLQKKVNDAKYRLNRNIITQNSDYTVAGWVQFWLENYKVNTIKSKTYDSYENTLNRHIKPAIGSLRLNKLHTDSIQQLYKQLHDRGLSSTTISTAHTVMSQAFNQAITNHLIYINPWQGYHTTKSSKKESNSHDSPATRYICRTLY